MTPEAQLRSFVAKFAPAMQREIRAIRKAVRERYPRANELVYDNYNFLVIAYSPTLKPTDSYFSIGADKNGVSLFFGYTGTKIEDPLGLLEGKGALNRFVRITSPAMLAKREIRALLASAVDVSKPMGDEKGALVIKSVSAKQRPRR